MRYLVCMLLLASCVAQSDKKPGAKPAVPAKSQVKKGAVTGQRKETQVRPKAPEEGKTEAQADTKKTDGQPEAAPAKTEAGQTEEPQAETEQDPKLTAVPGSKALGMSILGNQEAPTSLVIVPWKSSEVGAATGISPVLDDSRSPVDKEVFMRELRYYEIRSEKKP